MPAGSPSPDQFLNREVAFFSLDTNILEKKHFDFKRGALNVLHKQRPSWMTLQLTDVVNREVMAHRMRELEDAETKLNASINYLRRKADFDISKLDAEVQALSVAAAARRHFGQQMQAFVDGMGGHILEIDGPTLASDIFERYFALRPPFEVIKDKKSEFPDAAALLVLEQYAKTANTIGIVISNDRGWHSFATSSDYLFCVNTLEEFTGLFEAMTGHAAHLLAKVRETLADAESDCYSQMRDAINSHVSDASWSVGDLYSGYSLRLEGSVTDRRNGAIDVRRNGATNRCVKRHPEGVKQ